MRRLCNRSAVGRVNFLAHCLLARPGDGFLAGGVLGDFVKGPIPNSLPPQLHAGVRLHRRIDSCSNRLPLMKPSVARFDPALRRLAPVLLDLVADHCLALAWRRFAQDDVASFAAEVYAAIDTFNAHVPANGRHFVERMIETDLLARYAEPAVIQRAMEHVLTRLRFAHLRDRLHGVLDGDLPGFVADFEVYFPMLQTFAAVERQRIEAAVALSGRS